MSTSVEALATCLHASMTIDKLFIKDFSNCGCGAKFDLFIFSNDFEGMTRLDRHRHVQDILKDEIPKLHAITFKCCITDEYETKKALITEEYVDCSIKPIAE